MTEKQRAAILLQLGILIQEVTENYELGLDVQVAIIRHLFPDCDYETGKARLDQMFGALDRIAYMYFDKDPQTQKWQLAIAWENDSPPV